MRKSANRQLPSLTQHSTTGRRGCRSLSVTGQQRGSSPAVAGWTPLSREPPYRPREEMPSIDSTLCCRMILPLPHRIYLLCSLGARFSPLPKHWMDRTIPLMPVHLQVAEPKRRDELGRKLGDRRLGRSMIRRGATQQARVCPTSCARPLSGRNDLRARTPRVPMAAPASTPRRQDNLTPAGKRLLERSLGLSPMTSSGSKGSTGSRNKAQPWNRIWMVKLELARRTTSLGWTPSPARRS